MNLSSSVKYHIKGFKSAAIIFYTIVVAMVALSALLSYLLGGEGKFGGFAASSMIFLFVMGICSFYSEFRILNQNGISRFEQWKSFIISSIIVACAMSAIDIILYFLVSQLINTESIMLILSTQYLSRINSTVLNVINMYFMQVMFYTLVFSAGYLIRLIYYRMNKLWTTLVSIAVPAFFFIALPILSAYYDLEPIFGAFFSFLGKIMNPARFYGLPVLYIFFIALFAITALINQLLIRKAIIK